MTRFGFSLNGLSEGLVRRLAETSRIFNAVFQQYLGLLYAIVFVEETV